MHVIRRFKGPRWRQHLLVGLLAIPCQLMAEDPPTEGESEPEEPTPHRTTLIVSANDFEGMPMKGITFRVSFHEQDREETITTSVNGEAEIAEIEDPDALTVTLADEGYIAAFPQTMANEAGTILSWRLFRSDVAEMEREEREEFARVFHQVVRQSEDGSDLINEKGKILSRFLSGGDRGSAIPAPQEPPDEDGPTGALAIRLIDSRGAASEGSLVQLYSYQSSTNTVTLTDHERTNDEGFAVFSDLELGRYYRAEVVEEGGLTARSTITKVETEDLIVLPTMILRPSQQILSGIIVDSEGVAAGTLVTARRPSDGLLMTAATDSVGYFVMGPFSTREEVTLTLEQSTSGGVRTGIMMARPGEGEILVPLHVLTGRN